MQYHRTFVNWAGPVLAGIVLLHWFGPRLWAALPNWVGEAISTAFIVSVIGLFLYGVFWSLRFLRAPDAERQAMEAGVMGRLSRVRRFFERRAHEVMPLLDPNAKPPSDRSEEKDDQGGRERETKRRTRTPLTLSARESRAKKLKYLVLALLVSGIFFALMVKGQKGAGELPPEIVLFLVFLGVTTFWSFAVMAVSLLLARPLVDIGPMGFVAPAMYIPTIAWSHVMRAELVKGKYPAPFLMVEFAEPEGPASWRGLRGKCYGFFLRGRARAKLTIPLRYADRDVEEILKAMNHYLLDRGGAVVVRWRHAAD